MIEVSLIWKKTTFFSCIVQMQLHLCLSAFSLCSNEDSATSIAQGTRKKFLSEAQGWQQSEKQRLLRKFVTHKTKEKEQQQQLQLACPPRLNRQWVLYSPFLGQCCIKNQSAYSWRPVILCASRTQNNIFGSCITGLLLFFFLVCHCVNIECFHCQEVTALNQTLESLVKALYTTGLPYPIMSI